MMLTQTMYIVIGVIQAVKHVQGLLILVVSIVSINLTMILTVPLVNHLTTLQIQQLSKAIIILDFQF